MAASILTIIAVGVSLLWWWLRREADPLQAHRERYSQIDKEIARKDAASASRAGVSDLDELDRLQKRNGHSE